MSNVVRQYESIGRPGLGYYYNPSMDRIIVLVKGQLGSYVDFGQYTMLLASLGGISYLTRMVFLGSEKIL